MAKKAPRTFLCIGGPLSGTAHSIDLEVLRLGYVQYNRADSGRYGNATHPTSLLIHKTFLLDRLSIHHGMQKREADLAK